MARHATAFEQLPGYAHETLFGAYIQQAAFYPLRTETVALYLDPWRDPVGQRAFYRKIAQSDIQNIREVEHLYRQSEFEVHLIWGMEDTFIPYDRGEALKSRLSANSLTVVENAAHLVQEDAPEAIVGALAAHL